LKSELPEAGRLPDAAADVSVRMNRHIVITV